MKIKRVCLLVVALVVGCGSSTGVPDAGSKAAAGAGGASSAKNPDKAKAVEIDRFSKQAGMLMVRDAKNNLPAANSAIDLDQGPFITEGLGPKGEKVAYYNFDVQPTRAAPIYVFFPKNGTAPIDGQLNVIDVLPGGSGYSDFWQVVKVTVPSGFVPNSITSLDAIRAAKLPEETTDMIVNCPVVPKGSTAKLRLKGADAGLHRGWYQDQVVYYFDFEEAALKASGSEVPVSPIYVAFNTNPPEGGPQTGFVAESGSMQTHNVVGTLPGDAGYSPLWSVNVYDNADFDKVKDLATAQSAHSLATGVADVNCPIVSIN